MKRASAMALFAVVVAVAAVESLMAAWSYRERVSPEDWSALEAELEADTPAYLAQDWLSPAARMMVEPLARPDAFARPDLRGVAEFDVVALAGHDAWSRELERDLEGAGRPVQVSEREAGPFRIVRYEWEAHPLRASLVEGLDEVRAGEKKCPRRGEGFRCDTGRVAVKLAEVDYAPRHCARLDLEGGAPVVLSFGAGELGDTLRGHVGFHDFNARLRSDAPVRVRAFADEELVATWTFTDDQGWAPFAAALPAGAQRVHLELLSAAQGTWGRRGYAPSPAHEVCLEARTFMEGRG